MDMVEITHDDGLGTRARGKDGSSQVMVVMVVSVIRGDVNSLMVGMGDRRWCYRGGVGSIRKSRRGNGLGKEILCSINSRNTVCMRKCLLQLLLLLWVLIRCKWYTPRLDGWWESLD